MKLGAWLAALGFGAWMALVATPAASQPEPLEAVAVEPDRARLDRIYAEHDLDLHTSRAGWAAYVGYLVDRLDTWITARISGILNRLLGSSSGWRSLIYGVIGAALVALLAWLALLLRSMLRRRAPEKVSEVEVRAASPAAGGGADAATWRAELDRRLAAGDLEAALEAAWWWLASSVAGPRVNPAWTSRELLAAAGRHDLGAAVRGLDALIYGGRRLERATVERVVDRLAKEMAA